MTDPQINTRMNDLLVELHRSLVRYVDEAAYPWANEHDASLKQAVQTVSATQESHVKSMVEFLMSRGQRVDFGVYPPDYSSLHFVAIDYLNAQLISDQKKVIEELESASGIFDADADAKAIYDAAVASQKNGLTVLASATQSSPS